MTERIGPYELLTRLGQGGMGEVFLARLEREQGFAKLLALKRILPGLSGSPRFQELFAAEARLTAALNHPNIVQVVDFGSQAGSCYLVMEYVDGADLASLLAAAGRDGHRLPLEAGLAIGLACAQALGHAHAQARPVIHADVCSANVLIGRAGEVKLTDFGLARLAAEPGRRAAGHPASMAPEVAAGARPDALADQFGLGATLLELFTGQPAYPPRPDPAAALELARRGAVRKAAELAPDLHPGLAAVIDRTLAVDPGQRFEDLEAVEDALDRLAQGLGLPLGPRPIARAVAPRLPAAAQVDPGAARGGTLVATPIAGQAHTGRKRARIAGLTLVLLGGLGGALWWFSAGPGRPPDAVPPPPADEGSAADSPLADPQPSPDPEAMLCDSDAAVPPSVEPAGPVGPDRRPQAGGPPPQTEPPRVAHTPQPQPPSPVEPDVTAAWLEIAEARGWSADGRALSAGRQPLDPGNHLLGFRAPDGLRARVRLEVPPKPGPVGLSVQSTPYAILHLDGRPRGTTPIAGLTLAAGRHTVALVPEGGRHARLELKLNVP